MYNNLISIIVPIYNVELYLEKCIDSILHQTYTNIEVILVNDGSSDSCGEICDKYEKIDNRIKVVHKKNGGLSDARNAGIDVATGKYILFIDSDDYIEKDLVEKAYKVIYEGDLDLVSYNYRKVDYNGDTIAESVLNLEDKIYNLDEVGLNEYIIKKIYTYEHGVEACLKIYKMSIIKENKLKFIYNDLIFAEDLLFNLSYLVHVKKCGTISQTYYNYLRRETSIMGKPKKDLFIRYKNLFLTLEEYWKQYDENVVQVIPLGYFIWLISTIKTKLKEDVDIDIIVNEFKEISSTEYFKKIRKTILKPKYLLNYIKLCPNKKKHAILIYVIALLCVIKQEKTIVKIIKKYIIDTN